MNRILVLADETFVTMNSHRIGKRVNWEKLREDLLYRDETQQNNELIEFAMFVGLPPAHDTLLAARTAKEKFIYACASNGFLMHVTEGYVYDAPASDDARARYRANAGVMMALEGMQLIETTKPDVLVLATNDNDFSIMAQWARRHGTKVYLIHARQGGTPLSRACNGIIALENLLTDHDNYVQNHNGASYSDKNMVEAT